MKSSRLIAGLSKLLSLLLALAVMVSVFAVFATRTTVSAAEEEEEADPVSLMFNRTFDEGWALSNGTNSSDGPGMTIDKEVTVDYRNNYFWRCKVLQTPAVYIEYSFDRHDKVGTVIEFDLKVDDYCNMDRVMYLRTKGGAAAGTTMNLMYIVNNELRFFSTGGTGYPLNEEWVHVALVFDYVSGDARDLVVKAYFDNALVAQSTLIIKENQSKGVDFVRFGPTGANPDTIFGDSFCVDNFWAYSGTTDFIEVTPEMGCGTRVNPNADIVVNIEGSANPVLTALEECLAMKLGVEYCYSDGSRLPILSAEDGLAFGAPFKIDGKVMVSLQKVLEHMNYPMYYHEDGTSVDISTGSYTTNVLIGSSFAMVDGKRVDLAVAPGYATGLGGNKFLAIAIEDIEKILPGWYATYDDMGLIIICPIKDVVNRRDNLSNMTGIMKKFVFDFPSGEEIYEDVKEKTNNFDHPYLFANQEKWDHFRDIYNAKNETDEHYNKYMLKAFNSIVAAAEKYYRMYSLPDERGLYEEYVGWDARTTPTQPYMDSFGYDPQGGRLAEIEDYAGQLFNLAAAYQLTRDVKYAYCGYDLALAIGDWEHWGPDSVLNMADTAAEVAAYYDWTYDINAELGLDNDLLAKTIYDKTLFHAQRALQGLPVLYPCPQSQDGSRWHERTNNWNAVCTSGFGNMSLVLMDHEEYAETAGFVLSESIYYCIYNGMEPYAPDGTYEEGTAYWGYATNVYFRLCMALDNAAGTNYGLMDCWGMELTSYYACHTESSDMKCFNYNDSNEAPQTTYFFYYVAQVTNDPALAAIRTLQIEGGKNCALYDCFAFPEDQTAAVNLPLDYAATGLDIYTARSSWERGALFVGIIGGNNNTSHGQVDAGTFVYHNGGTVWFCDFGSDTYDVPGYWNHATRYRYYTMKAEGHNTIAISSSTQIPFGQVLDSVSPITKFETNEHGSLVLYDMTPALDSPINSPVSMWNRGLMLTNDRTTVVVQDELSLANIHTVYWFAHYHNDIVNVELSADGRTALMRDDKGNTLRVSIVSDYSRFKFEIMDCYTFIHTSELDGTYPPSYAANAGAAEEDRSKYSKLAIKAEDVLSFKVAVVIEMNPDEDEVPYKWTPMDNWEPGVYEYKDNGKVETVQIRKTPKKSEVNSSAAKLNRYSGDGTAFGDKFNEFYRSLTDLKYALEYFGESALGSLYYTGIDALDIYGTEYDEYIGKINRNCDVGKGIAKSLVGF